MFRSPGMSKLHQVRPDWGMLAAGAHYRGKQNPAEFPSMKPQNDRAVEPCWLPNNFIASSRSVPFDQIARDMMHLWPMSFGPSYYPHSTRH